MIIVHGRANIKSYTAVHAGDAEGWGPGGKGGSRPCQVRCWVIFSVSRVLVTLRPESPPHPTPAAKDMGASAVVIVYYR